MVISLKRKLNALVLCGALLAGSIAVSTPAAATEPVPDRELALTDFRAELVSRGVTADVVAFDAFTAQQRSELADYLVGANDLGLTPPVEATWDSNGVATYGDYTWGLPAAPEVSMARNNTDISIWGTQWFKFLGITLLEVKNTVTYTTTYSSHTGTRVTAIKRQACLVTVDIDWSAEVTSVTSASYPDVWEAFSQCKVTTKRGFMTPWGLVVTSTTDSLHTLRGDNMGNVVFNGFTNN